MPPPLSLAQEMRSVRGEKRPTERLQEGEVDSCFFTAFSGIMLLLSNQLGRVNVMGLHEKRQFERKSSFQGRIQKR